MKRGRPNWYDKTPAAVRRRVTEAVEGKESARVIFNRLNLKRFTRLSTFRHYCTEQRRELAARKSSSVSVSDCHSPGSTASCADPRTRIRESALESIQAAIDAGNVKVYELNNTLRMLADLDRVEIQQEAERRAKELHEAKLKELRAAVETETESGTKSLSRENVYDLVDKVMRGAA